MTILIQTLTTSLIVIGLLVIFYFVTRSATQQGKRFGACAIGSENGSCFRSSDLRNPELDRH